MKRLFNFRIVPICFLGIILAICGVTFCSASLSIIFAIAAVILIAISIFVEQLRKAKGKLITFSLVFLIATLVTSMTYVRVEERKVYSYDAVVEGNIAILTENDSEGNVIIESSYGAYVYLESVTVNGEEIDGIAQTYFSQAQLVEGLKVGDRIKFTGSVTPKNLTVTDSYSINDCKRQVYHYITFSRSADSDESTVEYLGNYLKFSDKIKLKIKSVLYANVKSQTAGFLYAMTLGDKTGLESDVRSDFQRTGAAHIFAVSGLHVGIIAAALVWLLKKLKVRNRLVTFIVVAAVLIPFCILCGSPSTVRATVMTLIALGAKIIMMRSDGLTNLSFAGCVILLINPLYLFDVGFLMSFFAILALLTLSEPIGKIITNLFAKIFPKRQPKKLVSLLSATVSVNALLMPIMVSYFGGQALLLVVANLIVIPIACVFFPIYLVALILSCILPAVGILLTIAGAPFTAMIWVVGKIGEWETLIIYFQSGVLFFILTILIAVTLSKYCFVNRKAKKIIAIALVVCICLTVVCNITRWGNEDAILYCYVDKYDNQYAIIENVRGGRYLITNGQLTDDSVSSTLTYMNKRGFVKIDGIVLVGEEFRVSNVSRLAQNLNCVSVYSFSDVFSSAGLSTANYLLEEGLTLAFLNGGTLEIIAGKTVIRVLAEGYSSADDDFDVLLTYEATQNAGDGQYIVCSSGYTNSLQNYMPTTFTFRLKNGKILVR
ncbi:MAG: ComEC/Rec2 family competence protein [Clostridia bacterium]|nr:ComEC/Rec2 family competence protein [Clostridia bacterium]MDE7328300.1 ComEC/Rec2 family competence protein [Clostridia bacterium]